MLQLGEILGVSAEELIQGEKRTESTPSEMLKQTVNGYQEIQKKRWRKWLCIGMGALVSLVLLFLAAGELLHWNSVTFSGLATRYQSAQFLQHIASGNLESANRQLYTNPESPTPLEENYRQFQETGAQILSRRFHGYYFNGADFAVDYELQIQYNGETFPFWASFTEQNGLITGISPTYSLSNPPPDEMIPILKELFSH